MSVAFGLLGSGFMARTYAQSLAKHVPDGHLVAVAAGSRAPDLARDYDVALEESAEALLARDDLDAVIICTPHSTHLPLTQAAAAAGKHVYIEKPMALTVAECDGMIAACQAAGVLLDVNHVTRHRASPLTAKGLLADGKIGELRMVRVLSAVISYLSDDHGWAHKEGEGGAWLDMGVHMFDALRWFTDSEVETVFASIRDFSGEPHQRRTGLADAVMTSGVLAQVFVSLELPSPGSWITEPVDADRVGGDHRIRLVREGPAGPRRRLGGYLRDAPVRAQRGRPQPDPVEGVRGPDAGLRGRGP